MDSFELRKLLEGDERARLHTMPEYISVERLSGPRATTEGRIFCTKSDNGYKSATSRSVLPLKF